MSFIRVNYMEIREDWKKYLALIILLFIYLILPVLSISLIILFIYTGYRWTMVQSLSLYGIIINVFLTILVFLLAYGLRLLILWLRE
jgi:hypothetical protein